MYNPSNIECSVCNSTNRTSYVTYNGSSVPLCRRHKEQIRLHGRITDINDYVMHDDYAEVIIRNLRDEEILKTKIDTEDVGKVKQHRWILIHHGYIGCCQDSNNTIALHNFVMGFVPVQGFVVDHINRDKYDNRKSNLRICTVAENSRNTNAKGVSFSKHHGKWVAQVMFNRKHYGKRFDTYDEALEYRKELSKKLFGEFAPL